MTRPERLAWIGAALAAAGIVTAAAGYATHDTSGSGPGSSYRVAPYSPPPAAASSKAGSPSRSAPSSGADSSTPPPGVARPQGSPAAVYVLGTSGRTLVSASLRPTFVDAKGILAPPARTAGWYANSGWAKPGYAGASILVGHVTFGGAPDTFYRLPRAVPGDTVVVRYSSGQQSVFRVTRSAAESKAAVPKDTSIWAAESPTPLLRLITCDPTTPVTGGHFQGNWVVWASPA